MILGDGGGGLFMRLFKKAFLFENLFNIPNSKGL